MDKTNALEKHSSTSLPASVLESIVTRGDLSGLSPTDRARFYLQMCEAHGLSATSQPFAFLRLNGKEILYATRGATDQLAAIHRLNREIIDGPKVIDLAGTKLVYAVAKATHPNGRTETATATVPLVDPVNVLMKAETKAKRRVTLSILGLSMLDEMELETIPATVQSAATQVTRADLAAVGGRAHEAGSHTPTTPPPANNEEGPPPGSAARDEQELAAAIAAAQVEEPASRAFAQYHGVVGKLTTLVALRDAYRGLVQDLAEEGHDPEDFTGGDAGAWAQLAARASAIGHRLVKTEIAQVITADGVAEVLDTQSPIVPCADALANAADWWVRHRPEVKALDQAHQKTPWYALVRRYSAAMDATATKKAGQMLDAAVKARDAKNPPPGGGSGGGAPRPTPSAPSSGTGSRTESAPAGSTAPAALAEFRAHLAGIPDRGNDRGAARAAGAFWKRRADFLDEGTNAEALADVIDELAARGVSEPHPWLQEIGEKNGYLPSKRLVEEAA